ncbi:GDSL esterase/lipase At1g29670-like [Primulina huaijiensis]|uniref:GDSL esterase/lipase At1g29670-like n=1 Tax=Primulina huaijiensis TaxID=1492673 RepID=UPI003CC7751E
MKYFVPILIILSLFSQYQQLQVLAEPQVPCFFIFGDSIVDNGNNNFRQTTSRADFLPYGIDFPGGPTGRFSNGRNIADILAELLGFEKHIPRYANATNEDFIGGVNYGSGGAGILDETGTTLVSYSHEERSDHPGDQARSSGQTRKGHITREIRPDHPGRPGQAIPPEVILPRQADHLGSSIRPDHSGSSHQSLFLIEGKPQVPCLFFFGDSLFDNGNNNELATLAKVDFLPYGIDYPGGPTGRFCNGRNIPDFIEANYLTGVNYASGAAGILDYTGNIVFLISFAGSICINFLQGQRYSLRMQIEHHSYTVSQIERILGNATQAKELLNKCVYVSNIVNNDYLNYFLSPELSPSTKLYTPDQFAKVLVQAYSKQLKILYSFGARKVAVFGTAPLGCIPQTLQKYPTNGKLCVEWIDKELQQFNQRMIPLVDQFNTNLPDAQFIFVNYTAISVEDITKLVLSGFEVGNIPCCVTSRVTGLCYRDSVPCPDRTKFFFWDNFHPTETSNMDAAKRIYNASSPFDTYPMDLQQLAVK